MSKKRSATLWCCVAALPLIGCAGGFAPAAQQVPPAPIAAGYYSAPPSLYPVAAPAPAAILVVLPSAGAVACDPALWRSEGVDLVTPPPLYRLAAEQQAALGQMMAVARQFADAPIWLIGPSREVEAALAAPQIGCEQIPGIVETSAGPPAATCSESFPFRSGHRRQAAGEIQQIRRLPAGFGLRDRRPDNRPMAPAIRPHAPRVIEAAATPDMASPAARRAAVERLAEQIKAAPSS